MALIVSDTNIFIKQVKAAYQKMEAENRRLPWDLVKQQLRKLESG